MTNSTDNLPQRISRAEAKAEGRTTYFTGKPCKHGHITERYVSSLMCKECSRLLSNKRYVVKGDEIRKKNKERYDRDPHRVLDRNRKWLEDNKDDVYARLAEKRKSNPEHRRAIDKLYYENNKEKVKQSQLAYRESRREELRQYAIKWRKENKPYTLMKSKEYKEAIRQAIPPWYDAKAVLEIYKERDRLTEESGIIHHVDHIIPLRGELVCGLHIASNLQVIPGVENMEKSNKYDVE